MSSRVGSFNVPAGFSPPRSPITSLTLADPLTYSYCPICLLLVSKCKLSHLSPPPTRTSLSGPLRTWQPSHFKAEVRTKTTWLLDKNPTSQDTGHVGTLHLGTSGMHWGWSAAGHGGISQRNGLRTFCSRHSEHTGSVWFAKGWVCFPFSEPDTGISGRTSLKWSSLGVSPGSDFRREGSDLTEKVNSSSGAVNRGPVWNGGGEERFGKCFPWGFFNCQLQLWDTKSPLGDWGDTSFSSACRVSMKSWTWWKTWCSGTELGGWRQEAPGAHWPARLTGELQAHRETLYQRIR